MRFFLKHLSAPNNSHVALWSPAFRTALLIDKFYRAFASYDAGPNVTCLPSKCGRGFTVTKNWSPFVFGPPLAMASTYGCSWYRLFMFSSSNLGPYMFPFRRAGLIHKSGDDLQISRLRTTTTRPYRSYSYR